MRSRTAPWREPLPAFLRQVHDRAEAVHLGAFEQPGALQRVEELDQLGLPEGAEDAVGTEPLQPRAVHLLRCRAGQHLRDGVLPNRPLARATPERTLSSTSWPAGVSIGRAVSRQRGSSPPRSQLSQCPQWSSARLGVAEVAQDDRAAALADWAVLDHALKLVVLALLPFLERGEVDLQVARLARAVDHPDGVAAERGDVVDRQLARQRTEGAGQGRAVESQGRGELVGVEVDGLGVAAVDQSLQAEQDDPLDVRLGLEPARRGWCRAPPARR